MISYGKQSIDADDISSVVEALKGDWLTQGPLVEKFEDRLKDYFGSKYVCAVSNGTAALHLTGLALDWGPEDIILTSPITFLATANAVIYCGAKPDFADIDLNTYTIDPNKVEEKIIFYQKNKKKVKAIIGVDYAGYPCDWEGLRDIANRYDLQLVNDNCHALGASYHGDNHYAVKYADVVTQSFHPVKNMTTGEGGAIITNSSKINEKVNQLRTHGIVRDRNILSKNDGPWYHEMHSLGFNYRITDFQSALGISQLKKISTFIKKRNLLAKKYDQSFSNFDKIKVPIISDKIKHAYHLYPLVIDFDQLKLDKADFFSHMEKENVKLQVHYIPIHLQPYYHKNYGFKKGDFPIAEKFYKHEVSIPIYPSLEDESQDYFIKKLCDYIL